MFKLQLTLLTNVQEQNAGRSTSTPAAMQMSTEKDADSAGCASTLVSDQRTYAFSD